eukprot:Plantae.Rhodophyta-Purpureofilum_apyrenoidigerum.ctg8940.p1 GENE.Plantae.Rhodophyta-Purpureofilum_apyrenoidigerum.ctg8940~~Plantae.Rhodophyta-Purpureofilum_apyrenoidigerum.ctg8940.p1  ORF type:complete len:428 (+),score=49.12 Plantae.Rhodophyta-Purpureofilum_apyrenoidigerum.ctg8940:50-1285(+)
MAFVVTSWRGVRVGPHRREKVQSVRCAADVSSDVVIVGGGIGGLTSAVAVKKATGRSVTVLERLGDKATGGGVSIALYPNGWKALDALDRDLAEKLRVDTVAVANGKLMRSNGQVLKKWCFQDAWKGFELRAVFRSKLTGSLLELAQGLGVKILYNKQVEKVDEKNGLLEAADGTKIEGKVIVGADGIGSRVRALTLADGPATMSPLIAFRGVADLDHDAAPEAMQVWGKDSSTRFGSVPITPRSMYWFVTTEGSIRRGVEKVDMAEPLRLTEGFPEEVRNILRSSEFAFQSGLADRNPTLNPGSGRVTLLGDALHPMFPHLGQGGAAAMEDSLALAAALQDAKDDDSLVSALRKYERSRIKRNSALQLRSRAVSKVVHWNSPLPALVLPRLFIPALVFRHCKYTAPVQFT